MNVPDIIKPKFSPSVLTEFEWLNHCFNLRGIQHVAIEQRAAKIESDKLNERLAQSEIEVMLNYKTLHDLPPPDHSISSDPFSDFLQSSELSFAERFVVALALAPHIKPELLDRFIATANTGFHTARGGVTGKGSHAGFMATGQTALFLFAGDDPARRLEMLSVFDPDHIFNKRHLLWLEDVPKGEPRMNGRIIISREIVDIATIGYVLPPGSSADFPAKRITTEMEWDDLILSPVTKRQVEEVKLWLKHRERLMDELGMRKRLKPGNKILFYGAPGTGKTLTAQLLGKFIQKDVFRIDLSMVVNKYIGETEKNLAKIFDKAEHSDWILFFDEADALFGSRTKTNNSNDRYANQEVSYLLQRIEDYDGIVILASNMKGNIDNAFMRRFSSVVNFPFPKSEERQQLWQKAFPGQLSFSADLSLKNIAEKYEVSGANITNIVAWCALMALEKGDNHVTESMVREGMARELAKEGRTI
jgi:AAA+ superfamily predicted ATPase